MVIKFSKSCTDEEKREVCMCLSQFFQLALNLPLQRKISGLPGYPIPLAFEWLKKANWPGRHEKPGEKHSAKPANRASRPNSAGAFRPETDEATAGGVTNGQLRSSSQSLLQLPPSQLDQSMSTYLGGAFVTPPPCRWPRSEAEEFLVISRVVHSKKIPKSNKRDFYFNIKAGGYEYHLYVERHAFAWETFKRVPGETTMTLFNGEITWVEQNPISMVYKCNLLKNEVAWQDASGDWHIFNGEITWVQQNPIRMVYKYNFLKNEVAWQDASGYWHKVLTS